MRKIQFHPLIFKEKLIGSKTRCKKLKNTHDEELNLEY